MAEIDDNKTTSYGNSDINKTETYGNSENQKTTAYSTNQEATAAYHDLQNKEFKSKTHGIGVGDKLTLRNTEFSITGIISEGTGEAVIYKIENGSKQTFALKLYFEFSNSKEEPNFETLKRIKDITDPDILKLHDFGVGADKYQGKYCYEISDFAEGGDLFAVANFKEKYTKDFIEKNIIPEILNGIRKLHEFKIYHCDLKPSNIFFKDRNQTDLLIGDYGSAKAYDILLETNLTDVWKGTKTYFAPEQADGFVGEKNDYHSFGMILAHLLYYEQLCSEDNYRQIELSKFKKVRNRQFHGKNILDFNPNYKRLNTLISGLTLYIAENRWGHIEVEKWLNGEEVEVKYKATESSAVQPVKLGYATITNDKDLIHILETRETWWEDIFEDVDTYFALKAWIGSYQDVSSRKIFDEMIHYYKPFGKEYVKESAIRYFDPEREIRVDMHSFNFFTTENLKEEVDRYIAKLDKIWKFTDIEILRFYFFQLEFSLRQLHESATNDTKKLIFPFIEKLFSNFGVIRRGEKEEFKDFKTEIQTKISKKDEAKTFGLFIDVFYSFNPNRKFINLENVSINSLKELGIYYIQNEKDFYEKHAIIEKEKFLEEEKTQAFKALNYSEFIFELFKNESTFNVKLLSMEWNRRNTLIIRYCIEKSLKSFLKRKSLKSGIQDFKLFSETIEIKVYPWSTPQRILKTFQEVIAEKHKIILKNIAVHDKQTLKHSFKKQYIKTFKIVDLIITFSISTAIGISLVYFVLSYVDSIHNPLLGYSFFKSIYNYAIIGLSTGLLLTATYFYKYIYRLSITILIALPLIIASVLSIKQGYSDISNIYKFRHNFYLNKFDVIETTPKTSISNKQILNAHYESINQFGNDYSPCYRLKNEKSAINIKADIPIVERTFYDPGFFSSWQTQFKEISYMRDGYDYSAKIELSDIVEYKKINYYPIKISFDAYTSVALDMSRFGIAVNRYCFLFNNSSLVVEKLSDLPKNEKPKKFNRQYLIIQRNNSIDFTDSYNTKNFKTDRPQAISRLSLPCDYLANAEFEKDNKYKICIYCFERSLLIEVNSKRVLSKEITWDNDYSIFTDAFSLIFEPKANFKMSNLKLSTIKDYGRYDKRKDGKDHKYISIIGKANESFKILDNNHAYLNTIVKKDSSVEILYLDNGFYKIRQKQTNQIGWCKESYLKNVDWDKEQVLEQPI